MEPKEIVMTDEVKKSLVDGVVESLDLDTKLKTVATDAAKAAAEAVLAKFDAPDKKNLGNGEDINKKNIELDTAQKDMPFGETVHKSLVKRYFDGDETLTKDFELLTKSPLAKMSKERRFYLGVKALINKDQEAIKELNAFSGEMFALKAYKDGRFEDLKEKAGYANDAVSVDGGALVPDPEFNTTVYDNLPKYGTIFKDGNVTTTDRTAVYALSLTGTIAFTNVAEAGAIAGTKLAFSRKQTNLIKYAAIVPATQELTEDSIVDYWQIVTNEISRAYGLVADQQVFTDPINGILYQPGILIHPLISGGAGTTIVWDDLLQSEGSMEDTLDTSDFVWYMRKDLFPTSSGQDERKRSVCRCRHVDWLAGKPQ
jgi:HK97 family phage major capsid protein